MKKINKNQFYARAKRKVHSALEIPIIKAIDELKVDEGIEISLKEWNKYFSPYSSVSTRIGQIFRRTRSNKKFSTRALRNDIGYMILRIN